MSEQKSSAPLRHEPGLFPSSRAAAVDTTGAQAIHAAAAILKVFTVSWENLQTALFRFYGPIICALSDV